MQRSGIDERLQHTLCILEGTEQIQHLGAIAPMNEPHSFTSRQLLFKELLVGTLIYTLVLGLFDEHASIVEAQSFRYVVLAAMVLETLTCAALAVKDVIVGHLLVTVVHRLADWAFVRLGRVPSSDYP